MKKVRLVNSELFNEKNISLAVKEEGFITKYREIMSNITINWNNEIRTYAYVKTQIEAFVKRHGMLYVKHEV